ncbi:Uncharacterized protein DAT39_016946 [Clarias magur]|uniref:Uncharacterized protein n=1 Tax=Clarias magur TaxID=1594786 RepID=A0A8J4UEN2_CLAMG|nr:Uncharacterized protein DAT39_016946 [Clarias magur]
MQMSEYRTHYATPSHGQLAERAPSFLGLFLSSTGDKQSTHTPKQLHGAPKSLRHSGAQQSGAWPLCGRAGDPWPGRRARTNRDAASEESQMQESGSMCVMMD